LKYGVDPQKKGGGVIIVSVMLDNLARRSQKIINHFLSQELPEYYAWMDTPQRWGNYFETFGLDVMHIYPIVSRYNIYYWTPFLRSRKKTDLSAPRVDES